MKKRIKLTDKELAIGMWIYIILYIESYDIESEGYKAICKLKGRWLEKHNKVSHTRNLDFYWVHNCWLCHKYWYGDCLGCPLGSCDTGSLYDSVMKYYYNDKRQAKALECAKRILNIILAEKEVEDEDN